MSTRIYIVSNGAGLERLVRAVSQAAARNYVARETLGVQVASQEALVSLLGSGRAVEDAGAEQQHEQPQESST
ncbi:MAG: hypothetical protein IT500_17195 [Rubrivivax sp.]|nr:hypothetical protein [Rubrivivax sp.]